MFFAIFNNILRFSPYLGSHFLKILHYIDEGKNKYRITLFGDKKRES